MLDNLAGLSCFVNHWQRGTRLINDGVILFEFKLNQCHNGFITYACMIIPAAGHILHVHACANRQRRIRELLLDDLQIRLVGVLRGARRVRRYVLVLWVMPTGHSPFWKFTRRFKNSADSRSPGAIVSGAAAGARCIARATTSLARSAAEDAVDAAAGSIPAASAIPTTKNKQQAPKSTS